jgi:glycosyltransferase involved in cell wall biosynthesis
VIVFCHLLNDNSGSPRVLSAAIEALGGREARNRLYVGSQGRGILERVWLPTRRYWYYRSRFRLVTLATFLLSQILLYRQLSSARDVPSDAMVYVNTLLPFGAALWAKRNGRRVVYHVHELSISPAPLRHFLVAVVRRTADLVVYVSRDHLSRLPIPGPPAVVLPNPVDPALQALGETMPYAPRRSGRFEVLMLASPRNFKGVPEFLHLASALGGRPDIAFTLVLNADDAEIARYVGSLDLPTGVRIHSRTDNPAGFFVRADLVVNLSRVDLWIETFGLTLAEAMSFGVPVIAPPVGGPAELVSPGQDGYLIDSRDHEALVATVLRLADDPALCTALSNAARKKARVFSQSAFALALRGYVDALRAK